MQIEIVVCICALIIVLKSKGGSYFSVFRTIKSQREMAKDIPQLQTTRVLFTGIESSLT